MGVAIGVVLIVVGIVVMSRGGGQIKRGGNLKVGYLATLGGAAIFGFTPILINAGLQTFNYPVPANAMAYAACGSYLFLVAPKEFGANMRQVPNRH